MKKTDVSFITINYNSTKYTLELIKSIKEYTTLQYEVIVIDNNSKDSEVKELENELKNYNDVKLIKNSINCGFACANNIAAKEAKGKYLFFINSDTKLLNDASFYLYNFLEKDDTVALATAKIVGEDGGFSSSYKLFPSLTKELFGNFAARLFNNFPSNKIELKEPTEVEVISGACMFFREDIFRELNGFDEEFFLYCEEEDICKRVRELGKKIYFVPKAKIFHIGGGSSKQKEELLKEYYISYKHLIFKHFNYISANILYMKMKLKIKRRALKDSRYKSVLKALKNGLDKSESLRYRYTK